MGDCFRIQITLVLVFIFSRYWSKSIIRVPPGAPESFGPIIDVILPNYRLGNPIGGVNLHENGRAVP